MTSTAAFQRDERQKSITEAAEMLRSVKPEEVKKGVWNLRVLLSVGMMLLE